MSTRLRKLISLLAVAALAVAQLAGLHRGWVCDCSGEPVTVTEQWCAGSACHEQHPEGPHDHAPGEHEHREMRDTLQTLPAGTLTFVPPVLFECLQAVAAEFLMDEVQKSEWHAAHPRLEDPGGGRPQENYARRTAVLLI